MFVGLTRDTADGYSMLCWLTLTYSAFDYFLRSLGVKLQNTSMLLDDAERDRVLSQLRSRSGNRQLFNFVRGHVDPRYQKQIDAYLKPLSCNPFYLAASLRHVFFHGILTATPQGVPSQTVASVTRYMCRVLMRVMEREFEKRMTNFEKEFGEWMSGR
jgi:hypothetical protein